MKLLGLVSLSNMVISYSLQCFTILSVFYSDLDQYIEGAHMQHLRFTKSIKFEHIGIIIGSFYLGIFIHSKFNRRIPQKPQSEQDLELEMSENSSNSSCIENQQFYAAAESKVENLQMQEIKRNLYKSFFLLSQWIMVMAYLDKIHIFGLFIFSQVLGGYGCGIFSQLTIELVNLSQSRKPKY